MDSNENAFNTICRICLSAYNYDMVSLFEKNNEKVLSCYGIAVLTFAKITILPTDNLPTNMCQDCLFTLMQAIRFKLKCETTHKALTILAKSQKEDKLKQKIVEYSLVKVKDFNICDFINTTDEMDPVSDNGYSDIDEWKSDDDARLSDDDDDNDISNNCAVKGENYDAILDELDYIADLQSEQVTKLQEEKLEKFKNKKCLKYAKIKYIANKDQTENLSDEDILDVLESLADNGQLAKTLNDAVRPKLKHNKISVKIKKRDQEEHIDGKIYNNTREMEGKSVNKERTENLSDEDILDVLESLADNGQLAKTLNGAVRPKLKYNKNSLKIKKRDQEEEKVDGKINNTREMIASSVKSEIHHRGCGKKQSKRSHQCEICEKVLANKATYQNHMQMHTGYKYICEHCGKGYPTKGELEVHLVVKHKTGNYLQCEHCDFKAPRRFMLVEHLRLHSGERPFSCEQCGLTFRRRGILKMHMKYHTEKSVKCDLCPRRFYTRGYMLAHCNNVHERRYVFACPTCGVTYAKTSTVRKHARTAHGIPNHLQGKVIRINRSETNFPEQ